MATRVGTETGSVPMGLLAGMTAGPQAAASVPQEQVGMPVPTPVSLAGAASMDPMFRYGPGSVPGYHASGALSGINSGAGPASGNALIPSPDEKVGTVNLYTEPGARFARINKKWADRHFMEDPQEDMIVFCAAQHRDPVRHRQGPDARRYLNVNVVSLNYILACQAAGNDVEKEPCEVFERWGFDGIVATETGKEEMHHHDERDNERLFNMRFRGPEHTFNIFGPNVQLGTKLYAIVRKFDVTDKKYVTSAINADATYTTPAKDDGSKCFAYQVSFFGDHEYDVPPLDALRYEDEDGVTKYGVFFRMGSAGNVPSMHNAVKDMTGPVPANIAEVLAQPKFKMQVSQY